MEWSPMHPARSESNSIWIGHWVCRSCSRSLRVTDLHPLPPVACPDRQRVADSVLDVVSADLSSVCMNCRRAPTAATKVPFPHVVDWWRFVSSVSFVWSEHFFTMSTRRRLQSWLCDNWKPIWASLHSRRPSRNGARFQNAILVAQRSRRHQCVCGSLCSSPS